MEIFLGKVFDDYELALTALIEKATSLRSPTAAMVSLLKEKYWIADRFAVVAILLTPATAVDDIALFRGIQKWRNRISHGADVAEDVLPISEIRTLTRRYIALHVEAASPTG